MNRNQKIFIVLFIVALAAFFLNRWKRKIQAQLPSTKKRQIDKEIEKGPALNITPVQAREIGRIIYKAVKSPFGTDEQAIYSIADQSIGNKSDWLLVEREFGVPGGKDLYTWLDDDLWDSEKKLLDMIFMKKGFAYFGTSK
jgi:hypothetical protein